MADIYIEQKCWVLREISVAADIPDINELEYMSVAKGAEFRVLVGETKAIKASQQKSIK